MSIPHFASVCLSHDNLHDLNSLAPDKCSCDFKLVIFKLIYIYREAILRNGASVNVSNY